MELVSIIVHEGKKIAFLNAHGIKNEDELCKNIFKLSDIAIENKINLFLLDVTDTHTTPKIRDAATKATEMSRANLGKVYSVLVGLNAMQRIIANAISRDQYFAPNISDAKKWLVSKSS